MLGINLHAIVRPAINAIHPDVSASLYLSTGQQNVKGRISQTYAAPVPIKIQFQTESAETLEHINQVGQEEIIRRLYLFSDSNMQSRIAGIVRPEARNGDMIQIDADENWYAGQWWLVTGVIEDFSRVGWQCVRAALQIYPPAIEVQP